MRRRSPVLSLGVALSPPGRARADPAEPQRRETLSSAVHRRRIVRPPSRGRNRYRACSTRYVSRPRALHFSHRLSPSELPRPPLANVAAKLHRVLKPSRRRRSPCQRWPAATVSAAHSPVVVPCSSLLERRKLQNDDGERRFRPFQSQKPLCGVASDHRFAAVFCDQGCGLREIFL